jgi:hypothetical protein
VAFSVKAVFVSVVFVGRPLRLLFGRLFVSWLFNRPGCLFAGAFVDESGCFS